MKKLVYSLTLILIFNCAICAQEDLLVNLIKEQAANPHQNITTSTFKSTRLINSQTTEMTGVGNLQFMVMHRFGSFTDMDSRLSSSNGIYKFLGLNSANTYITLDYTPIRWFNIGINYAPQASTIDGNLKFQLIRQQTGIHHIPITIDVLVDVFLKTGPFTTYQGSYRGGQNPAGRFSYLSQLLIARKFNESFSLQLMPTWVHYNIATAYAINMNEIWAIGLGGRYKITERIAIAAEYFRQLNGYLARTNGSANYQPDFLSLGVEFDTGGHVFQLFLTNGRPVASPSMFNMNTIPFWRGDMSIGFNLNRSFGIAKKKVKPVE